MNNFAAELIGQDEVQDLLDNLEETHPSLESVKTKIVPLHQLTGLLQNLLSEKNIISDLQVILRNWQFEYSKNVNEDISEAMTKANSILIRSLPSLKMLPLITLAPDLEQMILGVVRQNLRKRVTLGW